MGVSTEKFGSLKCTVSIGVSSNVNGKNFNDVFKCADIELYNAKFY